MVVMGNAVPTLNSRASSTPFKTRGRGETGGVKTYLIGPGAQEWHGALHDQFGVKFSHESSLMYILGHDPTNHRTHFCIYIIYC